jgi:hypothetical protein
MAFLFVGSRVLPPASFGPLLAETPLPWARSCWLDSRHRFSYRGLAPHKLTPMPGVHTVAQADG